MNVTALWRYPVKSLGGEKLSRAAIQAPGLEYDRRWVLIDDAGTILTQRECGAMALIGAREDEAGLHLSGMGERTQVPAIPRPDARAEGLPGTLWGVPHDLRLAGADIWPALSTKLGQSVRLAFQVDPEARRCGFDGGNSPLSLADDQPMLLTTETSLVALNETLRASVEMTRFRPNIVLSGDAPWDEDSWVRVRIGDAVLRITQKCTRCIITTINPATGARPSKTEPLKTLARLRKHTGSPTFGMHAVVEQAAMIGVGDSVEILERDGG